jgi:hypothetical protein
MTFLSLVLPLIYPPSWPDLFRPSKAFFAESKNVDARDKPGHDDIIQCAHRP